MSIAFWWLRLVLWTLSLPLRLARRWWGTPKGAWLYLEVEGPVVPLPGGWPGGADGEVGVEQARRHIERAARSPRIGGLLFVLRSVDGGAASVGELRSLLEYARSLGLTTAAWLPRGGGTRVFEVATAAQRIYLGADAQLGPLGHAVEVHYLGGALERLGVRAEVVATGRYKTAFENLTRARMSDGQDEQLAALLDAARERLLDALAEGRGLSREAAREFVDRGPLLAEEAVGLGLADAALHPDELPRALTGSGSEAALLRLRDWASSTSLTPPSAPWPRRYLAVVSVRGPIVDRQRRPVPGLAEDVAVGEALERVRRDSRAVGLLLHVDSRGGSALASHRIRRALDRVVADKPVVAWLGDAAASGGYLVAAGAQHVVAARGSLTGSIGVVLARPDVGALLERLGVSVERRSRGAFAGLDTVTRPLEDHERATLARLVRATYERFLEVVAQGRRLPRERVEAMAEGRVWDAEAAWRQGLVDEVGPWRLAVERLRERVGGPHRMAPLALVESPRMRAGWLAWLRRGLLAAGAEVPWHWLAEARTLGALALWSPYTLSDRR